VTTTGKLVLGAIVMCAAVLVVRHSRTEQLAVPRDMPANAKFLQTGFDVSDGEPLGTWIACSLHQADGLDWCRVTDQKGTVVYQGDFLPVNGTRALGNEELTVASINPKKMWVHGPVESGPVPAILLTSGNMLVPAADRDALLQRWARDSGEYDVIKDSTQ
jgi:hypothetical protein